MDYFDISITDVISSFGGGANNVLTTCYGDATLGGLGSPFCNAITRGAGGSITAVSVTEQNVASLDLEGFDITAAYGFEFDNIGEFDVTYLGTITDKNTLVPFDGGDPFVCAGSFGVDCGEPIPGYKHRSSIKWSNGPLSATLFWRHIGEVSDDEGLGYEVAVKEIDPFNYFDLSASYAINDHVSLVGGVDNVFAENPPILGNNQQQANTYPATYDVFGRTFFVTATARF